MGVNLQFEETVDGKESLVDDDTYKTVATLEVVEAYRLKVTGSGGSRLFATKGDARRWLENFLDNNH